MTLSAYMRRLLRVDLTTGRTSVEPLDEALLADYIGGAGFGARYLADESPDGAAPTDPDNPLIFMSGPLGNTPVRGSGLLCVITKGPMTNLATTTQANGFAGAFLRSCGYDGIILVGRAPDWRVLWVSEDDAALRDGTHLVGRDTLETQEILKSEAGRERGVSVFCIGPAGEAGVRFSVIMGDGTHTASKNGVGAVMGAKRLKALVIRRGKRKVELHDRRGLIEVAKKLHEGALTFGGGSRHKYGTNGTFSNLHKVGALPVKNYTTNLFPEHERMSGQYVRATFQRLGRHTCFNCGMNHILRMRVTEGPYAGFEGEEPEYEAFAAFGPQIGQTDAGTVFVLTDMADRLGLDVNETGWVLGWLMECFEAGLITEADTDGLRMNWGNVPSVMAMMGRIAQRKGIGDLLAEGVRRAAESVGGRATEMAVCTRKGATPRGHDHRARWPELLDTCLTNTSSLEATFVGVRPHLMDMPPVHDAFSPWEVPTINAIQNGWAVIEDCVGVCRFNLNYPKRVTEAYNAATGAGRSLPDLITAGKRIVNRLRQFNIRNGLTPEMEAPSPRYGSAPADGPAEGKRALDHWDLMRQVYYRSMGWDPETGEPHIETLRALGLPSTDWKERKP